MTGKDKQEKSRKSDEKRPDLTLGKLEEFLRASKIDFDVRLVRPSMPCFLKDCPGPSFLNRDTLNVTCSACGLESDVYDIAAGIHKEADEKKLRSIINRVCDGKKVGKAKPDDGFFASKKPHAVDDWPFVILGTGDDGRLAFIGRGDRLVLATATSITKSILLAVAGESFWMAEFGIPEKGKIYWDTAIDFIIEVATACDFNSSNIRGRGAWREKDGRLCYHDGQTTIGDTGSQRLYVRRPKRDIGITGPEIDPTDALAVGWATSALSFETPLDHARLLGWSILAPFAGALPWRPAILLTGESGSGKTTVLDYIVTPISEPLHVSGGESTEAGVRQRIGIDACGVVVDEAESDTDKKKRNRDALFSLMRMSTSDDAPIVAKGTVDGKGMAFQMRSAFLFAAISPEVDAVADDNRIFRVNLVRPNSLEWPKTRAEIVRLLTPEACAGIRARTWRLLPLIIETAKRFAVLIQDTTGRDARYSLAEGMLQAAYWIVLRDRAFRNQDKDFCTAMLNFYNKAPPEPMRNENEEVFDRLLDERIQTERPERGTLTMREILHAVHTGQKPSSETLAGDPFDLSTPDRAYLRGLSERYGVALTKAGEVCVAGNHHEIMRILGVGKGYHRVLFRHESLVDRSRVVRIAGKSRRCVVIGGVFPCLEGEVE